MKKIIIPTDFSEVATEAVHYGLSMAKKFNFDVTLIHVLSIPISDIGASVTVAEELLEAQKTHIKSKIDDLSNDLKNQYGISVETRIEVGMAAEEITELAKKEGDLIVMGSIGESGFLNKFLGSIANAVLKNSETPIMVVPSGTKFSGWKRIAFANNNQISLKDELNWMYPIAQKEKATIYTLSVEPNTSGSYTTEVIKNEGNVKDICIWAETVEEGLTTYCEKEKIDLLCIKPIERGFFEGFFHKSVTQTLIAKTPLPILAFKN
jgi:nucleotide-binding universal stress UspA family protein